ncbi:MAG: hypothetical protein IJW73_06845, partial [Candidatus Gastranaerophilales bacterium]|nr:hypothetical protein [Candidatus Gastranaerophilales bacterium]
MGNGVNNNNEFMKKLQETVMDQTWMKELYASNRAEQQAKIKGVFTVVAENSVTSAEKRHLEQQAESLQDKVERLEAKMAVLEEEMSKNADKIADEANKIVDLVAEAKNGSNKMEDVQKDVVKDATEDVFWELEQSGSVIGPDCVVAQIRTRIENDPRLKKHQKALEEILGQLDAKEAQVAGLVANAEKWITQRNVLKSQYGATKSTYDLLNASIAKIGATETTYVNSDYGTDRPIYSPEKANLVSKFSEDINVNVLSTNSAYKPGTKQTTKEDVQAKYAKYLGTTPNGSDTYSYENKAVQNLGKAIDEGLLTDLMSTGMSYDEVTSFFAKNFSGANIRKSSGNFSVPYGHGSQAQGVFTKLVNGLKNFGTGFKGALNTWDAGQGNTIDTNKQIEALSENYSSMIEEMAGAGFTFKEAMFAMFNPESGIFKDSGVVYNLAAQGETNRELNYFIEYAGDDKTAKMYQDMAGKIYDAWGVKPSLGADAAQYEDDSNPTIPPTVTPTSTPPSPTTPTRTDPIWFNLGENKNDKYSFVIDRDQDGAFSGAQDFVGGTQGASWLDDLKSLDTDGDNKLTGDELKDLKVLGTNYTGTGETNVKDEYTPMKGASTKGFDRENETTVEYKLTSAQTLGIEEINLADLEGNVNQEQTMADGREVVDVNNSKKFNDSFTFKMKDGQEVTAHRQDEDTKFMEKIYGAAYGKEFNISIDENLADDVIAQDYGEYDQFEEKFGDVFANINILKNAGQLAEDTRAYYNETLEDIEDYKEFQLIKSGNKAAAMKNGSNWDAIKNEVRAKAIAAGVPYDEEQMKGIYVLDGSLDPQGVVQTYKKQLSHEDSLTQKEANRRNAWEAIILTAKEGVLATAAEIRELIEQGKT